MGDSLTGVLYDGAISHGHVRRLIYFLFELLLLLLFLTGPGSLNLDRKVLFVRD